MSVILINVKGNLSSAVVLKETDAKMELKVPEIC